MDQVEHQTWWKDIIGNLLQKNILIADFIILGELARKDNNREFIGNAIVLGKEAVHFISLFNKQLHKIKTNKPFNDKAFLWCFEIWYSNTLADVSIELLFDTLQKFGFVNNDNTIRSYVVLGEHLDKELPRVRVQIIKRKK